LGILTYYQKKEHELIIKRYLENGVDLVSSNVDHALSTFRENWAQSIRLLREFKETNSTKIGMRKESLEENFTLYDKQSFSVSPFFKLKFLVGDDVFWESVQLLFAFVGSAYDSFENDIKIVIQEYQKNGNKHFTYQEIYDELMEEVKKLHDKSDKYYKIIAELQNLAFMLERNPLNFKDLENFSDKPKVIKLVKRLKRETKEGKKELDRLSRLKGQKIEN